MKFRSLSLISSAAMAVAVLAGCASTPHTRVDRDPGVDLKAYKTFAFFEPTTPRRFAYSSIMSVHLQQSTRRQLERLGYQYDDANPDLRVNYFLQVQDRQELRSGSTPGRFGYRGWGGGSIETVNYRAGTLAIDLVDAQRNALVWRGVAEGRVDEAASKNPSKTIETAVSQIFTGFPNGKGE